MTIVSTRDTVFLCSYRRRDDVPEGCGGAEGALLGQKATIRKHPKVRTSDDVKQRLLVALTQHNEGCPPRTMKKRKPRQRYRCQCPVSVTTTTTLSVGTSTLKGVLGERKEACRSRSVLFSAAASFFWAAFFFGRVCKRSSQKRQRNSVQTLLNNAHTTTGLSLAAPRFPRYGASSPSTVGLLERGG